MTPEQRDKILLAMDAAENDDPLRVIEILSQAIEQKEQTVECERCESLGYDKETYFRLYERACVELQEIKKQRKPLTDEEIHAIYDEAARKEPYMSAVRRLTVARAIESAHGIGEKE